MCPLDLVPFLGETNVIDVMFLRSSLILSAPVAGTVADWPVHQKTGTLSSWIGTCSNLADRLIRVWIRVASHRPLTADTAIADKVGRVNRALCYPVGQKIIVNGFQIYQVRVAAG